MKEEKNLPRSLKLQVGLHSDLPLEILKATSMIKEDAYENWALHGLTWSRARQLVFRRLAMSRWQKADDRRNDDQGPMTEAQ